MINGYINYRRRQFYSAFLTTLCFCAYSSPFASADSFVTDDGRFNSPCSNRTGWTDEPVCIVPFTRLLALPERFHNKNVLLVGFLVNYHGKPSLFPSEESFHHEKPFENISVATVPAKFLPLLQNGAWVTICGKFDARFDGPQLSLGMLRNVLSIQPQSLR